MSEKSHSKKIISAFNEFDGTNFERLDQFYSSKVHFQDPAVDLQGLDELKGYYRKMYKNVKSIRFDFSNLIELQREVAAQWTMKLQVRGLNSGQPFEVAGSSFFKFDEKGLVAYHRDYVDLSAMIYERIPVVGPVLSAFKNLALHGSVGSRQK